MLGPHSNIMSDPIETSQPISPPGPVPIPIWGNLREMLAYGKRNKTHEYYESVASRYGPVVKLQLGILSVVLLSGENAMLEAFDQKDGLLLNRPTNMANVNDITGKGIGISFSSGTVWHELRKAALKALTSSKRGHTFHEEIILGESRDLINDVICNGPSFSPRDRLLEAVVNIQCGVLFGKRFAQDNPTFQKLLETLRRSYLYDGASLLFAAMPSLRCDPEKNGPYLAYKKSYFDLYDVINSTLQQSLPPSEESVYAKFISETEKDPNSKIFTSGNIIRSMADMLIPSVSVSTSLDWAILYMVEYPQVQTKCKEEIKKHCGSRQVNVHDLKKLPYLRSTLTEVRRISKSSPITLGHVPDQNITLGGYHVPKDSIVVGYITSLSIDNSIWSQPKQFQPDRFMDKSAQNKLRFYGHGSRKCPGDIETEMILHLLFANLLNTLTFSKIPGQQYSFDGQMLQTVQPPPYLVSVKKNL